MRWAMGTLALLLVLSCACAGGLAGLMLLTGGLVPDTEWVAAAPKAAQPPASNAPLAEWQYWVGSTVDESLRAQASALLSGDEAGFLAVVDPNNAKLLAEHKRRFKVLRAMGPGVWTEKVSGAPSSIGSGRSWRVDLQISYCFGPSPCASVVLEVESKWSLVDNRLVMADLESSDDDWIGPRPWETDDLTIATGTRTIVGATKSNAWRLAGRGQGGGQGRGGGRPVRQVEQPTEPVCDLPRGPVGLGALVRTGTAGLGGRLGCARRRSRH